jgi:hypothetical protein
MTLRPHKQLVRDSRICPTGRARGWPEHPCMSSGSTASHSEPGKAAVTPSFDDRGRCRSVGGACASSRLDRSARALDRPISGGCGRLFQTARTVPVAQAGGNGFAPRYEPRRRDWRASVLAPEQVCDGWVRSAPTAGQGSASEEPFAHPRTGGVGDRQSCSATASSLLLAVFAAAAATAHASAPYRWIAALPARSLLIQAGPQGGAVRTPVLLRHSRRPSRAAPRACRRPRSHCRR